MANRLTTADIHLDNFADNLAMIRNIVGNDVVMMMVVKANAYGHGIEKMSGAAVLAGASYLGVVSLGELKRIRSAGIVTPVLIMNYVDKDSLQEVMQLDGSIMVMDSDVLDVAAFVSETLHKVLKIHIKIDTGMHRAGCSPDQLLKLVEKIESSPYLELEGLFTHFAESEACDVTFTQAQLTIFNECIESLGHRDERPLLLHCANSAAIVAFPETHFNLVRPGLIAYGHNPFPKNHPQHSFVENNFKPTLTLKTQVISVRSIEPGETVGYNRLWTAKRKSAIALLPVGYGDGYRRSPHNAGRVLIGDQYAPIVGTVTMDQTVVDVTDIEHAEVGQEVILLGVQKSRSITAEDLADAYGTVSYEILTSLSDRIERVYL